MENALKTPETGSFPAAHSSRQALSSSSLGMVPQAHRRVAAEDVKSSPLAFPPLNYKQIIFHARFKQAEASNLRNVSIHMSVKRWPDIDTDIFSHLDHTFQLAP